jgi:putative flippase GtrA
VTQLHVTVRAFRFAVSGVLATSVHVAIAAAMLKGMLLEPALANGIAFAVATVVSFVANTTWSFASRVGVVPLVRFATVSLVGCALAMAVAACADLAGFGPWAGIGFVVLVVPPVTFVLHNTWTYRKAR